MQGKEGALPRTIVVLCCLALLTSLAGCAPQRQWTKRGLSQTEFDQDGARCRKESTRATYLDPYAFDAGQGVGFERSVAQRTLFEQCMSAKGYRLEESGAGK